MKTKIISFAWCIFLFASCNSTKNDFDATGTFEATEITISAEQSGKLLQFSVEEGNTLRKGEQVGIIDTVQLALKAIQLGATKQVYASQRPEVQTQIASLKQQLSKAKKDVIRYEQLVKDGAANTKLLDDAKNQVSVLEKQISAQESALKNSTESLNAQMSSADIQKLQVLDQFQKCFITSPIDGVVLEKYVEKDEFAVIGKPLFKIADTQNMYLRAYITSQQLEQVKIGQKVQVFADYGKEKSSYEGTITWISQKSEFTPKTILTDDERANLVYAIKIAVKNNGFIKIGMYGEVKL